MTRGEAPALGGRRDWLLIPNLLTLTRFVAAAAIPVIFVALTRPMADAVALGVFVYASLTDFVDGWLARRWGQTSSLGATLDTLADKALLLATLPVLAIYAVDNAVWFWLGSGLIALREIGVTVLRARLPSAPALKVRRDAKWKTAAQMTSAATLLAVGVVAPSPLAELAPLLEGLGLVLFGAAVLLSVTTGVAYLRGALASGLRDSRVASS